MLLLRRFGILVLGVVLLAVGVALVVGGVVENSTNTFGWTAYAPLTSTTFNPRPGSAVVGAVMFIVGLIFIAAWWGARAARQTPNAGPIRRYWLLVLGVLILVGCAIVASATSGASYGFSSLGQPGQSVEWMPPVIIFYQALKLLVVSVGFGCVAGWVGVLVGRRRSLHP